MAVPLASSSASGSGGSSRRFYHEVEGLSHVEFQSITSHPDYQECSFEELRLSSYETNGPPVIRPTNGFGVGTGALANICLPAGMQHMPKAKRDFASGTHVYGAEMVTFRVGKAPTTDFTIHESLAVARSPFVRGALTGDWKEAQARIIPLPENEADAFQLYQQWIYTDKIPSAHPRQDAKAAQEYNLLVRTYILGERLMDSSFKDNVIDCILNRMWSDSTFDLRLSSLIYENTPPASPLRRLWRDVYVWSGAPTWLDEDPLGEPVHPEFTQEISTMFMGFWNGQRPARAPFLDGGCAYHEHAGGSLCSLGTMKANLAPMRLV